MKWNTFVEQIKKLGFDGDGDDFDAVTLWLGEQGHNTESVVARGETFVLKNLFEQRPGRPFDATEAAERAEREDEVAARVRKEVEKISTQTGINKKPGKVEKAHAHDVQVGRDRLSYDPKGGFHNFGEFAKDVSTWRKDGPTPKRLEAWTKAALSTYGSEGVGVDGGFAVPPEYRDSITEKVMGENSIAALCDNIPLTRNSIALPTDETTPWQTSGGIQCYWEGEAAAYTQSKPQLKLKELRLRKLTALVPVTEELLEDSSALGNYIGRKAAEKLDFKLGEAIFRGTGAGMPFGFLNSAGLITVSKETSQKADTVQTLNVIKMYSRMYAPWRANAVWFVHQDVEPELNRMTLQAVDAAETTVSGGGPVYLRAGTVAGSPFATLMGRPVITTQHCETVGDAGDICFCAMDQYILAAKSTGIETASSMHLWFDQDVQAFKFRMRADGQPWMNAAISPRDGSNTLGAFITLAARA